MIKNFNSRNSFRCLSVLDDMDYIPLDSESHEILYRSVKEALEHFGKSYSKAIINHISQLNQLSEREILTNCDLFEDCMYRLLGHGAVSLISKAKVLALRNAVIGGKSDLTISEILDPSLTINDVLNEIRRTEALNFVQKMSSYNHIALLYSDKDFLKDVLAKYFSPTGAPTGLVSQNPLGYMYLNLTNPISYGSLFGDKSASSIKENALANMKEWIEKLRSSNITNMPVRIAEDDATWWIKNGYIRVLSSLEQLLCNNLPACTSPPRSRRPR